MTERLAARLSAKGWTKKELEHLRRSVKKHSMAKGRLMLAIEAMLFWIVLHVAVMLSLTLSLFLLLLFVFLKPWAVYLTAAILGVSFGMLFELALRSVDWIERKHHYIGGVIIISFMAINLIIFSTSFTDRVPLFTLAKVNESAKLILGAVYLGCFFLPFAWHRISKKRFY